MATITIENVPDNVAKRIGNVVTFAQVNVTKKRRTGTLSQSLKDPENTASEWISGEEFINTLKSWTWK